MPNTTPQKSAWYWPVRALIVLVVPVVVWTLVAILSGCTPAATTSAPKPVVTTEAPEVEPTPEVTVEASAPTTSEFGPVEAKFLEVFHQAVPDTTLTDAEIVAEAQATAADLKAYLAGGGTGSVYLQEKVAADPGAATAIAAFITGAIALNPEIASDPNYLK